MTEPQWIERQRVMLRELTRLAAERAQVEEAAQAGHAARMQGVESEYRRALQEHEARLAAKREAAEDQWRQAQDKLAAWLDEERRSTEAAYRETSKRLEVQHEETRAAAEKDYQETCWTANTLYESDKKEGDGQFGRIERVRKKMIDAVGRVKKARQGADQLLRQWRQRPPADLDDEADIGDQAGADPLKELQACGEAADGMLEYLKRLKLPRLFQGFRWLVLFIVPFLAAAYPLIIRFGLEKGLAFSAGGSVGVGLVLWLVLYFMARHSVHRVYRPLCQEKADGLAWARRCHDHCEASKKQALAQLEESKRKRNENLGQAKIRCQRLLAENQARFDRERQQAESAYRTRLAEMQARHDRELAQAEALYRKRQEESQARCESDTGAAREKYERAREAAASGFAAQWQDLTGRWQQGMTAAAATVADSQRESTRLFPDWRAWEPVRDFPAFLRFGQLQIRADQLPGGLPRDEALRQMMPDDFSLPALLAFPRETAVLIRASDAGRARAVELLQLLMLRLLTGLPPGKVRFTIFDPVGLGENFAAFMHLADHDEHLVNSRIWTEQRDIDQRLADLTLHMENVIQKYLRNQFQSIEDYNAQAGEVAEPYRFLVVANFPVNFSVETAKRLVSIAASGPSCGVYTLISVDARQPLPPGFNLKDLEQVSTCLVWKDQRFRWKDEDFGSWPLQVDALPDPDLFNRIVQQAGAKAKQANRVEVHFDFLAPGPEQIWASDSRAGIHIPLGRAGATKKQYMQLGLGTSQHVLVAGKTGSGKSTFLHALITNLCLHYSPDEVELYLVDFKKGVEFKTYATHQLPHARVIAIESEREFGLSVLQRLDAELKQRGSRFRDLEVQDVKGFRQATGSPLPRILLIVDEFQEFFVEDDKVAQEASLLLDRLVRQGRAFGMHVLLGSQTLGGAYSLARATIDQMAVRIALQCSEVDAHLILSKDNSAARLLTRPGEAIYNDANGMVEGNNVFQVVWLPEEQREEFLQRMEDLARERPPHQLAPPIVFEGNAPAELQHNPLLGQLLTAGPTAGPVRAARAWLGEAVAIKDPTSALFRRQTGSNLMIIGQQEERALSILLGSLVSLAVQHGGDEARFYVLDGSPPDSPTAGWFHKVADALPRPVRLAGWRDLPAVLAEIGEEVERRQKANEVEAPALYLLVHGLQRFRDLRRADDDFGFGRREEAISPARQWVNIFREGPAHGVFNLVWCDNLTNVNRAVDRAGLREFEMRVLFQMSAADSSTLIDSPVASKLGLHRALYYTEEIGQPEKFRPYGLPAEDWLRHLAESLRPGPVPR